MVWSTAERLRRGIKTIHFKTCSRCNKNYRTIAKFSKVCDKCKKLTLHTYGYKKQNEIGQDEKIILRRTTICKETTT